jgi:hypothetical protein
MEFSTAGLAGAGIGLVLGWIDYKIVGGLVERALRRTDKSTTREEKDDYERRIRLFRNVLLVGTMGFFPVLGYVLGRMLFG